MGAVSDGRRTWSPHVPLLIFFFLASLYMLTMTGDPSTSMGVSVYETAESLIEEGDFALEKPTLETGVGKDGRYYIYEGLALVLVVALFYFIGDVLGADTVKFVWLTNQILTAVACLLLYLIGRELRYSRKTSLLLALVYGIGTMAWVHSRFLMPEPLTTAVYLAALLFLLRYKSSRKAKWLFLCGCLTGLAIIVRPDAPLFVVGIFIGVIALFVSDYRKGKEPIRAVLRESLVFLAPLLFFFTIYAYYNYVRFGDVFELGYSTKAQEAAEVRYSTEAHEEAAAATTGGKGHTVRGITDTLQGFAGMWFIPCRSMFFINPVLIFIFWALRDFWKKFRYELIIMGLIFVLHVALYSNRGPGGFAGSSAWGIRYMIPMTSFMVIVMGIFLDKILKSRKRAFRVFVLVFVVSAVIQFIGVSQPIQYTQMMLEEEYNTPEDEWAARRMMTMDPRWNLITQNTKLLLRGKTTDLMYYWYVFMLPGDVPGWVSGSLIVLVLILLASGYLLFKPLVIQAREPERGDTLKRKKKRRRM